MLPRLTSTTLSLRAAFELKFDPLMALGWELKASSNV